MDPLWPRWAKLLYVILTLTLFGVMMWAFGRWVAYPFGDFLGWATDGWSDGAKVALAAAIPVTLYSLAYLAHRRDQRLKRRSTSWPARLP